MRVLVADDHELLRDTLELYQQQETGIEVICVPDLESALAQAGDGFDLVLLDYDMPGMNGLEGLRSALNIREGLHVAIISGIASRNVAERALAMGAAGFLPKTMPARSLVNAIRFMAAGERYAPVDWVTGASDNTGAELSHPRPDVLTKRELQVLQGLCGGKSNKQIARDLNLSEPTVKLHIKTLYRRLGVNNRTQAAMVGRSTGLC